MPFIDIANLQSYFPGVKSIYTITNSDEEDIDLTEDSATTYTYMPYFALFSYIGPRDPVQIGRYLYGHANIWLSAVLW